jgi:putative hydrolase of the HAD superfamily
MPPIPPQIRVVVFDAVGTLIHPEPSAVAVYHDAGRRFGSRLDATTVAARFATAFRRQEAIDHAAGLGTDEAREVARWRAIVGEVLVDVFDPQACFRHLYEHFAGPSAWRVEPGAAATFAALKARGYGLGIASNFDHRLRAVLAEGELKELPTIVSAAVGWRKPAGAFFAAVCREFGARPPEVLYVGDDADNDYHGARAAGLAAVLFDPAGRAPAGLRRVSLLRDLIATGEETPTTDG